MHNIGLHVANTPLQELRNLMYSIDEGGSRFAALYKPKGNDTVDGACEI